MRSAFRRCRIPAILIILLLSALPHTSAPAAPGGPDLPASQNAADGYHLFSETLLSPVLTPEDPDRNHIAIAYNTKRDQYLVVWHNTYPDGSKKREIIGQRLDRRNKLVGANFVISYGATDRVQPAVAYNAKEDQYLVVWMQDVLGDGKKFDIWGVRLSYAGAVVGSPFLIQTWDNQSFWSPDVVWNGSGAFDEYVVVWSAMNQNTQESLALGLKILDKSGSLIYGTIPTDVGFPTNPDITWDPVNQRYLLVWNYLNTYGKQAIRGDLRDANCNRIRLVDIYATETVNVYSPRVSSSMGLFFLVTFQLENDPTNNDIWVAWVSKDGTAVAPAALVDGPQNDTSPDVAGSSTLFEFMVVYQRADAQGAKVHMMPVSNYLPLKSMDLCNYFGTDCLLPAVTYGGRTFMNGYLIDEGLPPDGPRQHVYTRPFYTGVLYLPLARNK